MGTKIGKKTAGRLAVPVESKVTELNIKKGEDRVDIIIGVYHACEDQD